MKVQVLVATTNQSDHSLIKKMNIKTDALIGNQCGKNSVDEFEIDNMLIEYLNFAELGEGLNRNNSLMRANADICLFADDDMIYEDNYKDIVEKAFNDNPSADIIVFNLREKNTTRSIITKKKRVGYFNYLRYGTARIAVRLSSIK